MGQDAKDVFNRLEDAIEIGKAKVRSHLLGKSKAERFLILRENYSNNQLKTVSNWALLEEDYEICQTVMEVYANNLKEFSIQYSLYGKQDFQATVVKFNNKDGYATYHVDYTNDEIDEVILNLYKANNGLWISEWASTDNIFVQAIGEAIQKYEDLSKK